MNLEKLIYNLLKTEPYYAHFILNCEVRYDMKGVETAGAGVVNGIPILVFNRKFMESKTEAEQTAILKHECLHLLLDHHDSSYYNTLNKKVWNIAMDGAINQYISNLPQEAVSLEVLSKLAKKPLEAFQTSVYYYNALYEQAEKVACSGVGPLDDHDALEESEMDKQIKKGVVSKASEAAVKAAAGNVPEKLQQVLASLREKPQVNWKQQLRNFVASSISSKLKQTRTKANRRFELDQPGRRKERKLKLAVCVDSSGSVSNPQFEAFLTEVTEIARQCAEANLIYADCEVQHVINLKQGAKPPPERYGNGGTAYQPAITKAMELGCNVIAYFGDMDTADTPVNPGVPVLWITCGSTRRPGEFGRMLEIKG